MLVVVTPCQSNFFLDTLFYFNPYTCHFTASFLKYVYHEHTDQVRSQLAFSGKPEGPLIDEEKC